MLIGFKTKYCEHFCDFVIDYNSLDISVYLIYTTEDMLAKPNILYPAINAFSSALQSPEPQVQTNCLRILSEILR